MNIKFLVLSANDEFKGIGFAFKRHSPKLEDTYLTFSYYWGEDPRDLSSADVQLLPFWYTRRSSWRANKSVRGEFPQWAHKFSKWLLGGIYGDQAHFPAAWLGRIFCVFLNIARVPYELSPPPLQTDSTANTTSGSADDIPF